MISSAIATDRLTLGRKSETPCAQLTVAPRRPKALRFLIGDDCQIELM